jgi:hypothetical protein
VAKNLTVTVRGTTPRGYVRGVTFAERRAIVAQEAGKPLDATVWPTPDTTEDGYKPCRKPNADGTSCKKCVPCAARAKAYRDAVGRCNDLLDLLARGLNAGHTVTVNVESGASLPSDSGFGTITAPSMLADLCNDPAVTVNVAAGADDPRDYIAE